MTSILNSICFVFVFIKYKYESTFVPNLLSLQPGLTNLTSDLLQEAKYDQVHYFTQWKTWNLKDSLQLFKYKPTKRFNDKCLYHSRNSTNGYLSTTAIFAQRPPFFVSAGAPHIRFYFELRHSKPSRMSSRKKKP